MCLIIIIICAIIAFMVWASADIGSNIYMNVICRANGERKEIALTFDDGPDEIMTPRVLDVLHSYNISATFFLVGEKVKRHPDIARRIVNEGHIVGNHTFSHKGTFTLCGAKRVMAELSECNRVIAETAGVMPRLFRPPFGVTNPIIGKVARKMGVQAIGWSIRSMDTIEGTPRVRIYDKVIKKLHSGAVILLHDRCRDADKLIQQLIPGIMDKGYDIISLEKLLNINSYED